MFEALDLSSRVIPQLKDICKQFDIDAKGLTKSDMILKIIDAQALNKELAAKVAEQFTKKPSLASSDSKKAEKSEVPETDVVKVKKPRIQKLAEGEVKVEKTLFEIAPIEKPVEIGTSVVNAEQKKPVNQNPIQNNERPSRPTINEKREDFYNRLI